MFVLRNGYKEGLAEEDNLSSSTTSEMDASDDVEDSHPHACFGTFHETDESTPLIRDLNTNMLENNNEQDMEAPKSCCRSDAAVETCKNPTESAHQKALEPLKDSQHLHGELI